MRNAAPPFSPCLRRHCLRHYCSSLLGRVPAATPALPAQHHAGCGAACRGLSSTLTGASAYCRPRARLYGPYLSYSGDAGAVTDQQSVVVVAVFSEPVTGMSASSFTVTGPATGASIAGVKLVQGTSTYYHAVVNLPASYWGNVQVSLSVSAPAPLASHAACLAYSAQEGCRTLPADHAA